jgi:hypothetical protein
MPAPIAAYWEALPAWIPFGLAVLAALLLLGIAVYGWVWWPKRVVARLALSDPKARADVEDNFRKTAAQALGGIAVLAGVAIAYLQFLEQQRSSHDLLISNQVSKGFEQLGNKDEVVIRLGGIYALEGVMNYSDQYHQPVLEALTAFVRNKAKFNDSVTEPPSDIQAALTVIGRRSPGRGAVNLSTYIARADLMGANLMGADLGGADLRGANLNDADLRGANLITAKLSGAKLINAKLRGADLRGADLSFVDLTNANLSRANLTGAKLSGDLSLADLTGAELSGADLGNLNLSGANLTDTELTGANLRGAILDGQKQLDEGCGSDVVLPRGLITLKPCPPQSSP